MADVEAWPNDLYPTQCSYTLVDAVQTYESPFGGGPQSVEFPGAVRWQAKLTFSRLNEGRAGKLDALISRARLNPVRVPNFRRMNLGRGVASLGFFSEGYGFLEGGGLLIGAQLSAAAGTAGDLFVDTSGWFPDSEVLQPGDTLEIAGHLYLYNYSRPLRSGASGQCQIPLHPPLRADHGAGTLVQIEAPGTAFRLVGPRPDNPTVKPGFSSYELTFIEDLNQ